MTTAKKRVHVGSPSYTPAIWMEGFDHAIALAARKCEERAVLNDAVEGEEDMATDAHTGIVAHASEHRAIEARHCAEDIRNIQP